MLSLEGKRAESDGENNVYHMWELVKLGMVERARNVCRRRDPKECVVEQ